MAIPQLTPANSSVTVSKIPSLSPVPSLDASVNSESENDEKERLREEMKKHKSKGNITIKGLAKMAKKQIRKMAV